MNRIHLSRLLLVTIVCQLLLLTACMPRIPLLGSQREVDTKAVEGGQSSLIILHAETPEEIPVESRWTNIATGQEIRISTHFLALTPFSTQEYDMITVPPGIYTLTYLYYSRGSKVFLPWNPYPFDSNAQESPLGQVIKNDFEDFSGIIWSTTPGYALRSRGLMPDGSPSLASFTVPPGKVLYGGDLIVSYLPVPDEVGAYPAEKFSFSIREDFERAREALADEAPSLAPLLTRMEIQSGALASPQ